jgi:hypothetical protein
MAASCGGMLADVCGLQSVFVDEHWDFDAAAIAAGCR